MISPEAARKFALDHFPRAPEKLVDALGISIRESEMSGCDGWCLVRGEQAIIRINSRLGPARRRFTLAHELGHLILGIPGVVGETFEQMLSSDLEDEKRVNELASEILIPTAIVRQVIPDLPVVSTGLKRLAKKARVSELAAAIRVCNLAADIGLINASVVLFDSGDTVRWQWSKTLTMREETANHLLQKTRNAAPNVCRYERDDGNIVVGSIIENPYFGSATLFVQLLPKEVGLQTSHHERRKQLEVLLFSEEMKLQQRLSGCFGAHKGRIASMTKVEAIQTFWERYEGLLEHSTIDSIAGREYVELRIGEWF